MFQLNCEEAGVDEWMCGNPETSETIYPLFRESGCPANCQAEVLEVAEFDSSTSTTIKGDVVSRHCYMHTCDPVKDWMVSGLIMQKV